MPKKTKPVYLAGPATGAAEFDRADFDAAAEKLRAIGLDVINPADLDESDAEILDDCSELCLLPGWMESGPACAEFNKARSLGIRITSIADYR